MPPARGQISVQIRSLWVRVPAQNSAGWAPLSCTSWAAA